MMVAIRGLLLVLVFVPRITFGVHRCYSTTCSSSHVCIRVCQTNEHYCHLRFSPNRINQLFATEIGCGNTSRLLPGDGAVSTDNSMSVIPDVHYSCKEDLCNNADDLTASVQPLLEIPLNLPKDPPPLPRKGIKENKHRWLTTLLSVPWDCIDFTNH